MTAKRYETSDIWGVSLTLALSARGTLLAYLAVITLTGMTVEQFPESGARDLISGAISLFMGFWLTVSMMHFGGLSYNAVRGGLGTYLGVTLLLGLILFFGFFLFVFPAFFLAIRLAPVIAIVMAEDIGLRNAFVKAWETTRGHFWEIAGAMFIPLVLFFIALGIAVPWIDSAEQMPLSQLAAQELAIAACSAAIVAIGLAVYGASRDRY